MKQNINNNSESKNVVKNMKQILNNDSNLFNEVDLKLFGVQAYGVTYGEEYNVITKAARRANGRYYFITREGYEIAWSTIPADKVAKICADMFDQMEQDKQAAAENYNRVKRNGVALIRSELMQSVYELADAEGVHLFMLVSGVDECGNVLYKMSLGSTSDEGEKIAKEREKAENAERIEAERKANHSAEFLAEFKEREAEKIARRIMEGEAVTVEVENGETLYHVNGMTFGKETAERVVKYIAGRKSLAANALEMGGPSDYFSNEMNQAAAALDRIAAAERPAEEVEQIDEGNNTTAEHTEPATEPESEPQSEPKAPTLAEIAADYAAGTADSIRRRWHSFKNLAARVALTVAPVLAILAIFAITGAVFYWAVTNVPAWVESLPILPRAFVGVLFIFLPTMGVEMLVIKAFYTIDRRRGWFGFNPCGC